MHCFIDSSIAEPAPCFSTGAPGRDDRVSKDQEIEILGSSWVGTPE